MQIRSSWLIKLLGFAISWVVRVWIGTLRFRYKPLGAGVMPTLPGGKAGRFIYAFWHEDILVPAYHYARPDVWVLISEHSDGRLIAEACRNLGFSIVTGSTTRGAVEAMRKMTRVAQHHHIAITPDGPRGPRRRVQLGVIGLASLTGLPIVPFGLGYAKAKRLHSWDRFALPCPFSEIVLVSGEPIHIPEKLDRAQLAAYRAQVETAMERVSTAAKQLVGRPAGARATWPAEPADETKRAA